MASAEGETAYFPLEVSYIITIIINSITFRFIILLNMLVIKAVKTTLDPDPTAKSCFLNYRLVLSFRNIH